MNVPSPTTESATNRIDLDRLSADLGAIGCSVTLASDVFRRFQRGDLSGYIYDNGYCHLLGPIPTDGWEVLMVIGQHTAPTPARSRDQAGEGS